MSQDRVSPAFLLIVTLAVGTGMANASENCFYDIDDDGSVGAGDLSYLLGAWGGASLETDLDGSGLVDAGDLALLLGAWGPCPEESTCYAGSKVGYVSYVGAASDATDPGALIVPEDAAFAFDGQATCPDGSAGMLAGGFPDAVTVQYVSYQVEGATFSEARAAIFGTDGSGPDGLGVIGANGIQYAGYTSQQTTIHPGCFDYYASNETLFQVTIITYVVTIQYPVWNAPTDAAAEELAHWETFQNRLLNHEMEHVQILRDWQNQILWEAWGPFDSMDGIHLWTGASGHCPEYHGDTLIPGTEDTAKLFVQYALNEVFAGDAWADMELTQELFDHTTNHGDVFAGLPE
jgi:hypothetical protein